MDIALVMCTGIGSLAYMINDAKKFSEFKKFKTLGYVDNYHLLQGKLNGDNNIASIIQEHTGGQSNILIKNTRVEIGKKKTYVTQYPVQCGKTVVQIPQYQNYIDWQMTHNKISYVNSMSLDNKIKLLFTDPHFIPFFQNSYTFMEKFPHKLANLYALFDKHNINYKNGTKIRITEDFINNGDNVNIFGKYVPNENKTITVKYIGDHNSIVESVRRNIFKFNYMNLSIASFMFVSSVAYSIYKLRESIKKNHINFTPFSNKNLM